jgi:hypothetical protein
LIQKYSTFAENKVVEIHQVFHFLHGVLQTTEKQLNDSIKKDLLESIAELDTAKSQLSNSNGKFQVSLIFFIILDLSFH